MCVLDLNFLFYNCFFAFLVSGYNDKFSHSLCLHACIICWWSLFDWCCELARQKNSYTPDEHSIVLLLLLKDSDSHALSMWNVYVFVFGSIHKDHYQIFLHSIVFIIYYIFIFPFNFVESSVNKNFSFGLCQNFWMKYVTYK